MGGIAGHAVPVPGDYSGGVSLTAQQIYENFQHGPGASALHGGADELRSWKEEYEQLGAEIKVLMAEMEPAWQGKAGEAAVHGAGPMAVEFAQAQPQLDRAQDLVAKQGGLFDVTRTRVVPVPPSPPAPSGWDMVLSALAGQSTDAVRDYETQLGAHNEAAKRNVAQMRMYAADSEYNKTNMPDSYGRMLAGESGIHVEQGGGGPDAGGGANGGSGGWGRSGYAYRPGGGGPGVARPASGGAGSGGTGGPGVSAPPRVSGGQPGGPTTTGAAAAAGAGYGPAMPGQGQAATHGGGPGTPVPRHAAGGSGPYAAGGFGGAAGGSTRAGPVAGAGTGRGAERAARGAVPGEPEGGSRSGVGRRAPGGAAAEEVAGRGASRSGGRGIGAMPRGGTSGGDDDHEHARPSYLVMSDPDDFWFGGMAPVAPAVIE